jgi:predicted thioredoxin/glutaredoxin
MKGTLEFDLDKHDEVLSFRRAQTATHIYIVAREFDEFLRLQIKNAEGLSEREVDILTDVRDKFSELLNEYDLDIYRDLE